MKGILKKNTTTATTPPPRPSTTRQQETKKVLFGKYAEVQEIASLADFFPDDIANLWFVAFEYAKIKRNNRIIAKMIDSGSYHEDEDVVCFRGLENKTVEGARRRKRNIQSAFHAVLSAQTNQVLRPAAPLGDKDDKNMDWEAIRDSYVTISSESEDLAHATGLADAFIAWHDYEAHALPTGKDGRMEASSLGLSSIIMGSSPGMQRGISLTN